MHTDTQGNIQQGILKQLPALCLGERNVAACLNSNWHFVVSCPKMSTAVSVGSCSSWASEPWHRDRANRCQPGRQHLCTAAASYKTSGGRGDGVCPPSYVRHFSAVAASFCMTGTEGKGMVKGRVVVDLWLCNSVYCHWAPISDQVIHVFCRQTCPLSQGETICQAFMEQP